MKNNKNNTWSEQFQNTIIKSYREAKPIPPAHKYMTTHCLVLDTDILVKCGGIELVL